MINPNWQRWIFGSVALAFDSDDIKTVVDGDDRNPVEQSYIEVRMDGPRITETTRNQYDLYVAINVALTTAMTKDVYLHQRNIGIVQALFVPIINIYKIGDTDPPELLGCLRIIQGGKNGETLRTNNMGQMEKTVRLQQATVEGHYHMNLVGD